MATVVNNSPNAPRETGNSLGLVLGILLLVLLIVALFYYGLPALNRGATNQQVVPIPEQDEVNVNVDRPEIPESNPTEINVPDQVDVNINAPSGDPANPAQ